jgi:hypothetical protein
MKKLISNTGGMHTYLELKSVDAVEGLTYLRVTTTFEGSKDPGEERTKFDLCLDQGELANLRAVLNDFKA